MKTYLRLFVLVMAIFVSVMGFANQNPKFIFTCPDYASKQWLLTGIYLYGEIKAQGADGGNLSSISAEGKAQTFYAFWNEFKNYGVGFSEKAGYQVNMFCLYHHLQQSHPPKYNMGSIQANVPATPLPYKIKCQQGGGINYIVCSKVDKK